MTYPNPGGANPQNPDPAQTPPANPPANPNPGNTPPATNPAPQSTPPAQDPADEPLRAEGMRALQAERAARQEAERQLTAANQKIQEAAQRDMTELQRAQAERDTFKTQLEESAARERRNSIAIEFGIPADRMVFLNAPTEEALREQAKGLKELIDGSAAATAPPAFAPNPGQAPGNGTPPPPNTATVDAGRSLYQQRNNKSN